MGAVPTLKKGLNDRQLRMIAIGGVIGAGLFVGSGVVIGSTGPASFIVHSRYLSNIVHESPFLPPKIDRKSRLKIENIPSAGFSGPIMPAAAETTGQAFIFFMILINRPLLIG